MAKTQICREQQHIAARMQRGRVTGEPGKVACTKGREGIGLKAGGQPAYLRKEAP